MTFHVDGPDRSVGLFGPQPECVEQTCTCDLTTREWDRLLEQAARWWYEYAPEEG